MKKLIQYGLALFLVFAGITCARAQVIYINNFNASSPAWVGDADNADLTTRLTTGTFYLTHKKNLWSIAALPLNIEPSKGYSIETTLSHVSGADNYYAGITFGGSDASNLNYFGITANGNFIIGGSLNTSYQKVSGYIPSTLIKMGNNQSNKLRMESSDGEMRFYINGQQVYKCMPVQAYGNKIGVIVAGPQTAGFNYINVSYLEPKIIANNQRATKAIDADVQSVAYQTSFDADDQNQWVLPRQDSASTSISGGHFTISRTGVKGATVSVTQPQVPADMDRQFLIETEAVHTAGSTNYGYGLIFGADATQAYGFYISSNGYYAVYGVNGSTPKTLIPWTATTSINQGDFQVNKLTVTRSNGSINFYINDLLTDTYPDIKFTAHRFGVTVTANQTVNFNKLLFGYTDKGGAAQLATNKDVTPPQITIITPAITRGLKVVAADDAIQVTGIAKDASGVKRVAVNNQTAMLDDRGNFSIKIALAKGDNELHVTAIDSNDNTGKYDFVIAHDASAVQQQQNQLPAATTGKFYALLIGIQDYKDLHIPSLDAPVRDAENLKNALLSKYTFMPENVISLKNPTRRQITRTLDSLSHIITKEDNLLIFYAGHGDVDDRIHEGYWLPVEATFGDRDSYLSNTEVRNNIAVINSKHTLIIVDACYGATILTKTRALPDASRAIQVLYEQQSRQALTSGAFTPVTDQSVFMKYLLQYLNDNTEKYLDVVDLHVMLMKAVAGTSSNDQIPQFGFLQDTGHLGGEFIFIKKDK